MNDDDSDSKKAGVRRFWLEYGAHPLELRPGTTTIGRSASCQLVLDDGLVSRRHAELTVTESSVSIRDLESSNGVFVNEKRINESCELAAGDRIVIGKQEMLLRSGQPKSVSPESRYQRFTAETLHGIEPPSFGQNPLIDSSVDPVSEFSESTHQGDALELLGAVADKVLALGRGAEAERILATYLTNILDAARGGTVVVASAERAVLYAVKLAAATGKSRWVDYAFDLYRALKRPLPAAAVDQLYTVLRGVSGVNLQGLRDYVGVLRGLQQKFGPNERFVVQRIEGLERLAALK